MRCTHCGRATKVTETRSAFGDGVVRRLRGCSAGHTETTYEINATMWNAAKHDIRKVLNGRAYNEDIAKRAEQAERMRAERAAGVPCPVLAERYGMSVHMARYYTRVPRALHG